MSKPKLAIILGIILLLLGKFVFKLPFGVLALLVILLGCLVAYLVFGLIEKDTETKQEKLLKKLKRQIK